MIQASIVIPVFNRAHLVHRAIDSALAQTIPCEVLLVDHGSTDNIAEVAERYESRIRYVRRATNLGAIAGWRDGVEHATGDFVHITYDDDWIEPEFMERCLAAFDDDVGFVYSRVRLHRDETTRSELSVLHPPGKQPVDQLVQHLLRTRFSLSPGCAVFRRSDALLSLLEEIPGASGRFGKQSGVGEDLLLFLLTTLRYPYYVHIGEPLADFLAHSGSITVGAIRGGRSRELADAYEHAKAFYLSQPGALERLIGPQSWIERITWLMASNALGSYTIKLLQRAL